MIERQSQNNFREEKRKKKQERIALVLELSKNKEGFPFPGIRVDSYNKIKADEEENPGYSTPIDELLERFKREGMKIVLGKFPESGNVFVLPCGSDDIENDSLFPRHLSTEGGIDEKMRDLILKD